MIRFEPLDKRIRRLKLRNRKPKRRENLKWKRVYEGNCEGKKGFWSGIVLWSKKEANSSSWEPSLKGDSVPLSDGVRIRIVIVDYSSV
ncbi:hypothetical protein VNO77_12811 [Canavalia gladiata]|uniref:Uncharacterized protein n=1 Tax=Canavalia gladiata TaxID=3824 RepID=A0AAN9LWN9_CANGL